MMQIISDNHLQALKLIVPLLTEHNIQYQITGGLAGNIYGSQWPLHDIDIEVAQKDMTRVAELFKKYTFIPLSRFVDEEFDLLLLTLRIQGIDVEINQAEDAFIFAKGIRVKLDTDLSKAKLLDFADLKLYVQPLEDIIKYKELLDRKADLKDLKQIASSTKL